MSARLAIVLATLCACAAFTSRAGEVLLVEDFEKLDLAGLASSRPNWVAGSPGDLTIVEEAGHGKVLRINGKGGWPHLSVPIDVNKVRGHQIRVAAIAKFTGTYTPLPGKDWARPKLQLIVKDKSGKDSYAGADIQPGKPDWQNVEGVITVDKDADSANVFLRVDLVTAEVFFDDLSIEMDPDLKNAPPKTMPAGTPVAVTPANPTPLPTPAPNKTPAPAPGPSKAPVPAPVATGPEAVAKKAPKSTIDDGGILFGPEMAVALQKQIKAGAAKNTFALLGPGIPLKELDAKLPEKWTRVGSTEKLFGPTAGPRALLAALPDFISKNKPEVIFFFGETVPGPRKTTSTEHFDWEDVARLCLRMGAMPVIAISPATAAAANPAEAREDLRTAMSAAAGDANCPAIDLKVPSQIPRKVAMMTDLFDKFVFCRVEPDAPVAGATKKPAADE